MAKDPYYQILSLLGKEEIRKRKEQGETMHLAPLGYRNVRKDGRSATEPEPESLPLVEQARALRRQGHSIRGICETMAGRGLRSKRGKVIGPSSVLLILGRS